MSTKIKTFLSVLIARRIGFFLILLGVGLIPLALLSGLMTLRGCPNYTPDIFGIDISRAQLIGINTQMMTLSWSDGCNWHESPLLPLLLAPCLVAGGLLLVGGSIIRRNI